ncbi:MAG TPA: NPCBM/NEW2 domain-containing protein [Fimbriimonadaceae bacterium]|nr:NPCBM/NEW2 domain-containing protein [Fimbriimonadaceae bacterium]
MFFPTLLLLQTGSVRLESLDLSKMICGWEHPRANQSVEGHSLKIGGVAFEHGVGTHAVSEFRIKLSGGAQAFTSQVGVDDETQGRGTVEFEVWVDGKRKWSSGKMSGKMPPKACEVSLSGAKEMTLVVQDADDGIDYDHADWADAMIALKPNGARPVALRTEIKVEPPMPIAYGDPKGVTINGPRVIGTTPGKPFLFKVPVTGLGDEYEMGVIAAGNFGTDQHMRRRHLPNAQVYPGFDRVTLPFKIVKGVLPKGLTLSPATGTIQGAVAKAGTYKFTVQARSSRGSDRREYTVVAGEHKLALTPPMGWNSWNVWAGAVSAEKVKASADAFMQDGLASYGYQYVNIDDTWEGGRDANGMIQTNKKFGDMKSLADYVHKMGLKLGIYSGPGPKTCAGFEASYKHELDDAKQYANWGIDYLKYDWCSYGEIAPRNPTLADYERPYIVMRDALDQVNRDIVYSLCQYGMGDVYKWGRTVAGGNLWRTTGDITDTWNSMSGIGFSHSVRSTYVRPGGWNDPDMLVVGRLGWGPNPRPTRLTPNEQITHITLWSMLAAPLIIGCDLTKLDKFTKAVLCNHDVIEVDQDPLGVAATQRMVDGKLEVWARPLWDGTMAVGLFNRGTEKAIVKCDLSKLGFKGPQAARNLWLMQTLRGKMRVLQAEVPAHGAQLFKVGTPK